MITQKYHRQKQSRNIKKNTNFSRDVQYIY